MTRGGKANVDDYVLTVLRQLAGDPPRAFLLTYRRAAEEYGLNHDQIKGAVDRLAARGTIVVEDLRQGQGGNTFRIRFPETAAAGPLPDRILGALRAAAEPDGSFPVSRVAVAEAVGESAKAVGTAIEAMLAAGRLVMVWNGQSYRPSVMTVPGTDAAAAVAAGPKLTRCHLCGTRHRGPSGNCPRFLSHPAFAGMRRRAGR